MERKRTTEQAKAFDAVGMVRAVRDAHAEEVRGKGATERIAYYREKARRVHRDLDRRQEEVRGRSALPP